MTLLHVKLSHCIVELYVDAHDCHLLGKGLTLIGSVLEGDYAEKYADALAAKQTITTLMKKEKVPGFAEVIVADNTVQGLSYL